MRGKLEDSGNDHYPNGLIPAHAGKTQINIGKDIVNGAHPRACGENLSQRIISIAGGGSSPRMRGKPREFIAAVSGGGLIPAHAGKTSERARSVESPGAHPRACGENEKIQKHGNSYGGSSPRMRGKPADLDRLPLPRRLIPAHAGKTHVEFPASIGPMAHPRACGEN